MYYKQSIEIMEIAQDRKQLGAFLKSEREKKGIKRNHLREKGLRYDSLMNIEEGRTNYTIDLFFQYLKLTGITFINKKK